MDLGISRVIKNGDGNTLIYTALLAAIIANCTPTLADAWYFSLQQKWKAQLENGQITPENYWTKDIIGYYTITAGYYGLIFITMLALSKNDFSQNSKILLALVGSGLVIGVAFKNIEKDKQLIEMKKSLKNTP
jgi:hypothetical protein